MKNITEIFRAGRVRRWHTNPDVSHTDDRTDGHGARVARLIMALHLSPSYTLVAAALTHDDGECAIGDVSGPAKLSNPAFTDQLNRIERDVRVDLWGYDYCAMLTDTDKLWLKFADMLDAFIWVKHHTPHVLDGDGWPETQETLTALAVTLGCVKSVGEVFTCHRV